MIYFVSKALQLRLPKDSKKNQIEVRHFNCLKHQCEAFSGIRQLHPDQEDEVLSLKDCPLLWMFSRKKTSCKRIRPRNANQKRQSRFSWSSLIL